MPICILSLLLLLFSAFAIVPTHSARASGAQASGLQIGDSATAQGVNTTTYQPINRTQTFKATDLYVYSWVEFVNVVSPSHNVTWVWKTPWGQVYTSFSATIPDPGSGRHYPKYFNYGYIDLAGYRSALLPGAWQVDILTDGTLDLVQNFTITCCQPNAMTPQEIRNIYDVTPLVQSGYTGKGVTVAVIMTGVNSTFYSDIQGFAKSYGLPDTNLTVVQPFGANGTDIEPPSGETTADVEWVHAMAPDAPILLVLTGQGNRLLDGFSYVIDNKAADVATMSALWWYTGQSGESMANSYNSEYAKSVPENITLIAASGDGGANNTYPWNGGKSWTVNYSQPYMLPAYSPYVTAVGGSDVSVTPTGGSIVSEIGWNQSGGGPSILYPQPSWQKGTGVPNNGFRDVPDVALDASKSTGYITYFQNGLGGGAWGTSLGSPTFAGIIADIDQAAGHRVGFLNPTLYSIASSDPSSFRDITSGCSIVDIVSTIKTGYCASQGWDFVTGLGSPDAVKLLHHLAPQATAVTTTTATSPSSTTTSTTTNSSSSTSASNSTSTTTTSTATTSTPIPEFPSASALSLALFLTTVVIVTVLRIRGPGARESPDRRSGE